MQTIVTFQKKVPERIREDSKIEFAPVSYESFIALARGRDIYILSVNLEGIGLSRRLSAIGLKVKSFLDSRFVGRVRNRFGVLDPETYLSNANADTDLVIVCTKDRELKKKYIDDFESSGFRRLNNLFTPLDICRYFPTIEVAGKCNLQCKTCDMGLPKANKGRGFMSHAEFSQILKKMTAEIPLMNSVALYTWGEPLLNPEIGKIVEECRAQGIASEISTNLEYHKYLDDFLLAQPDQIVAPCAGIGSRYERGRFGGTWENYKKGLNRIAQLRDLHRLDYNVRIMYHLYKDNLDEDLTYMKSLASDLGFTLIPIVAHIFPTKVYQYAVHGKHLPREMEEAEKNLLFSLEEQLAYSLKAKEKKCHITNAFPTISWDGKVVHCCNMTKPLVGRDDYISRPLLDFIDQRNASMFCTICMDNGVHRYFDTNIKLESVDGQRHVRRI
jgi:MoaA/NifB/PqqE/SkfB family radical SAM enzyme